MIESTFIPVIVNAVLTPNPARVGEAVWISVAAVDIECIPRTLEITSGTVASGLIRRAGA